MNRLRAILFSGILTLLPLYALAQVGLPPIGYSGGGSSGGGGGGSPTGPAGGDLSGTYPNPVVSTYNSGSTFGLSASENLGANIIDDGSGNLITSPQPASDGSFTCANVTFLRGLATAAASGSCSGSSGGGLLYSADTFTNSGNNYTITTTTPTFASLADGAMVCGVIPAANTAEAFLNVGGSGSVPVYRQNSGGGFPTGGGDLPANLYGCFQYSSATPAWILQTPVAATGVVSATNATLSAVYFASGTLYAMTGSGTTLTVPHVTTLVSGGYAQIIARNYPVTVTPNASDVLWINGVAAGGGGVGGSIPAHAQGTLTTDGVANVYLDYTPVGTVTSVALSLPNIITVTGSPITSSGTLTGTLATQSANTILAGPTTGSAAAPTFRALVAADIPGNGGAVSPVSYIAGNWYWAFSGSVGTGVNGSTTVTQWWPYVVTSTITIDALGGRIATVFSGGKIQIALYASNASGVATGSPLATTTDLSTTTATMVNGTVSDVQLTPGLYWFGLQVDNTTVAMTAPISTSAFMGYAVGAASQSNLANGATLPGTVYRTTSTTYGTWPTNPTVAQTSATSNSFAPIFQVKSVP